MQHIFYKDDKEALFANFKTAGRSSIRKPPNAISWVMSIKKVLKSSPTSDVASYVRVLDLAC